MTEKFVDTFATHLFIEMVYGRRDGGLLAEQYVSGDEFEVLCESYGLFKGCSKMADELYWQIYKAVNNGDDIVRFKPSDDRFIESVEIVFESKNFASYKSYTSKVVDGKFNPLVLAIRPRFTDYNELKPALMHELMHAYEDWCRQMNNAESIYSLNDRTGYFNAINADRSQLSNIGWFVKEFVYFMNSTERNAYIGQMKGMLDDCNTVFKSIEEVLEYLKGLKPYKDYQIMFSIGEFFLNTTNEERKDEIMKNFKTLSNYDFKSYEKLRKWVKNVLITYQKKFNTMFARMARERLKLNWGAPMQPNTDGLQEVLDIMKRMDKMNKK